MIKDTHIEIKGNPKSVTTREVTSPGGTIPYISYIGMCRPKGPLLEFNN